MYFKILPMAILATFVRGGVLHSANPVLNAVVDKDYDPLPHYAYAYDVHDTLTGDSKSQVETRLGDVVHGQYSLNDPDGTRRIVDYTADAVNGFNAIVRKAPLVAAATPVFAKAATPVVAKVARPLVQGHSTEYAPYLVPAAVVDPFTGISSYAYFRSYLRAP